MDQERTETGSTPYHVLVKRRWPHLTDDEIGRICGRRAEVQALLKDAYRGAVDDARRRFEPITTHQANEEKHATQQH